VPFRQWYEAHYALPLARKKGQKLTEEDEARIHGGGATAEKPRAKATQRIYDERQKTAAVEPHLLEQFQSGRVMGECKKK
jgi:small subunit ribosomal protein S8e